MKHELIFFKLKLFAASSLLVAGLIGCYESTDATLYEPGIYKGKSDPLLQKLHDEKFQAQLEQRFKTSQTDR